MINSKHFENEKKNYIFYLQSLNCVLFDVIFVSVMSAQARARCVNVS